MASYIVHDAVLGTATARPILRWGECPDDLLADQAIEANDLVVEVADLSGFDGATDAGFDEVAEYHYTYDTLAGTIGAVTKDDNIDYLEEQALLRAQMLLTETAWTQTIEGAFTDGRVQEWLAYRKALREVPLQSGFPTSIVWPTPPSLAENDTDPLWARVYRRGNIIGDVSKTPGLTPTGALIEERSNPNGRYRRLAGGLGTQMCWHRLASSASNDVTWTFPAPFSGDNLSVTITPVIGSGLGIMAPILRPVTATGVAFSIVNASGSRILRTCELFAIGQWS